MHPRSWRELLRGDGDSETHKCTVQRGWRTVCAAGLRTDKDMGNFWAWFWLIAIWGAKEVLSPVGEKGSEQECSQSLWDRNLVNQNLFPSTLIVGSCLKAPWGQARVCLVTDWVQDGLIKFEWMWFFEVFWFSFVLSKLLHQTLFLLIYFVSSHGNVFLPIFWPLKFEHVLL